MSFRKKFLTLLLLASVPLGATAEVVKPADAPARKVKTCEAPVPSCPAEEAEDTGPWQGTVALGLSVATGEDNIVTGSFNSSATYESRPHELNLVLSAFYSVKNSRNDANRQFASGEYRYYFLGSWYGFGASSVERNIQQDLRFRVLVDAGPGNQFLDRKRPDALLVKEDRASAQIGLGYQYQRFSAPGDATVLSDFVVNLTATYTMVLVHNIRWSSNSSFILAPTDLDDWRVLAVTDLTVPLVGNLGLQGKLTLDYLNGPLLEARQGQQLTFFASLGVSYSF